MASSNDEWIEIESGHARSQFKLLVVDDSGFVRNQIKEILSSKPVIILEAEDGLAGLEILKKNPDISLILCDVNMPRMDGFALLEKLSVCPTHEDRRIPVIMLTAESKLDKVIEGKKFGAVGWITKPPVAHDIIALIEKYRAS